MDITFEKVGYTYQKGTPFQNKALYDIDLEIKTGSFTALVGHTGSGKSTILQHLNALMKPTEGKVTIGDREILPETNNKNLKGIRKKVGIVFQFPEAQLFEETVEKDICFGPMNFGVPEEDAKVLAKEMLTLVGLDETYLDRSPFDLSGGQMRRVAIAGVLAMEPEVLVLDEPTAGLDPKGRKDMMEMFHQLYVTKGLTIVLVTHQMDDVADYADQMIVLEGGTIVKKGLPTEIFKETEWLEEKQLGVPTAVSFGNLLKEKKGIDLGELPITTELLADLLVAEIEKGRKDMMEMFHQLYVTKGLTIVLVTHQMDDVADYADQMIVLEGGTIVKKGLPTEIFKETEWLEEKQLGVPTAVSFGNLLKEKKGIDLGELPITTELLADLLVAEIEKASKAGAAQ